MSVPMFIYVCLCCTIILAVPMPVLSLETEGNSFCTENGECFENKVVEKKIENKCDCSDNDVNTVPLTYELTDEFGNIIGNVSIANITHLLQTLTEKRNTQDKIQKEVVEVFRGVIIAVTLFGVCACICVFSACIYCCRINITDYQLKNDVEALSEKLKRECRFKKSVKKTPPQPISESCNIIVEDAGVFVV